jgi:hypothetical protein
MNKTIVLISSNRGMEPETRALVSTLQRAGGLLLLETGSADVAYARNRGLSFACEALREYTERDTVLMIDDDMSFSGETAQLLVDRSRELGIAVSGAYATKTSKLAGCRWPEAPGRWLVGLGGIAIPRALLLSLEAASVSFESAGRFLSQFTWCSAENGGWVAEDYRLSKRLGGVHLEPVGLGHVKKGELWPDDETIAAIAKGEVLSNG